MTTMTKDLVLSDLVPLVFDQNYQVRKIAVTNRATTQVVFDNFDLFGQLVVLTGGRLSATAAKLKNGSSYGASDVIGIIVDHVIVDGTKAADAALGSMSILVRGPAIIRYNSLPAAFDGTSYTSANIAQALDLGDILVATEATNVSEQTA